MIAEKEVDAARYQQYVPRMHLPMIPHTSHSAALSLLAASILVPSSVLGAGPATWDDLPNGDYLPTPLGYVGYNWYFGDSTFGSDGSSFMDIYHGQLQYSTFGGSAVTPHSGDNAAYNAWGSTPMRVESLTTAIADQFTFSGWFSSQGYPGFGTGAAKVQVKGFIGVSTTPAFTTTFSVNSSWVQQSFTTPVNKLLFSPLDINDAMSIFEEGYFYLDDAQLTPIPEPATWTIASAAACGLFALLRRRTTNPRKRTV